MTPSVTWLQRYYGPLRHPSAPGLSLTGVRLIFLITHWGFPCCVRFPCVHAAATTPVQQLGIFLAHLTPPYQPSPIPLSGRPAHRPFRGLLSVHSRCGLHTRAVTVFRDRYPKASDISSPPCLLRLLPAGANRRVGLAPTEKRRLVTAHVGTGHSNPAQYSTKSSRAPGVS